MKTLPTMCLGLCVGLLLPAAVAAQQVTDYALRFYQGGAAPVSTYLFAASVVACGQPAVPPPGQAVNPTRIVWDDPDAAGLTCQHDTTASGPGPMFALPVGTYTGALVAMNIAGTSPESDPTDPFLRVDPPGVLTGVLLVAP